MEKVLAQSQRIRDIAEEFAERENWLFLGRGYHYPVALEGALKLKEISYIHAEGMPAAEMKHGPIALINDGMPVVFIATQGIQYDKVISNIEEVRARGGKIIAVATEGDASIRRYSDHVIYVPDTHEPLQPLLSVIPLQLLAYHAAVIRRCNRRRRQHPPLQRSRHLRPRHARAPSTAAERHPASAARLPRGGDPRLQPKATPASAATAITSSTSPTRTSPFNRC